MRNIVLLFTFISILSFSQNQQISAYQYLYERGEVYFKFQYEKNTIALIQNHISIDKLEENYVYAYANDDGFNEFLSLGIHYEVLTPAGLKYPKDASEWDEYPTYQEYLNYMSDFESNYPSICKLYKIGESEEGRDILFVKISDNVEAEEEEPEVLYTATMHGDELTCYVLSIQFIDYLLSEYVSNPRIQKLIDELEIWINPLANPDGTYNFSEASVFGATRYNSNGVDLNRNFPDPEDGNHPDGNDYQKENIVMMDFVKSHDFVLSANFHTGAELVNYPWDTWWDRHAEDEWFIQLSRQFADTIQTYAPSSLGSNYFTQMNNGITNGFDWYTTSGSRQDYMNWFRRCREVTIEISDDKSPPSEDLPDYWEANYRSWIGYLEFAYTGIEGIISDSLTGKFLRAKILVQGFDFDNSAVFSDSTDGYYSRLHLPGTYSYNISCSGYYSKKIDNIIVVDGERTRINAKLIVDPGTKINVTTVNEKIIVDNFSKKIMVNGSLESMIKNWKIYDINGRVIKSGNEIYNSAIDISFLKAGIYFLYISEKKSSSFKFVRR